MFKSFHLCLLTWIVGVVVTAVAMAMPGRMFEQQPAPDTIASSPEFHAGTFEEIAGKILIHVKLNDTLDTRLMVDSGASTSLLAAETINALHIPLESYTVDGIRYQKGKLAKLALGNATLTNLDFNLDYVDMVSSWNKDHPGAPIGGLLGLDTLERNALGLDFATQTYGLWMDGKIKLQDAESFNSVVCTPDSSTLYHIKPGKSLLIGQVKLNNPAMRQSKPQALPLDKSGNDEMYHSVARLNDVPVTFFLDTGASGLSVTASIASTLKGVVYHPSTVSFPGEKPIASTMLYVRKFQLGAFTKILNLVTVVHRPKEDPTDTLLGVDPVLFANCRIILDFPGHTLYLSPYDSASDDLANRKFLSKLFDCGLFFPPHKIGPRAFLLIGKGSAAEKAGIKNGDELLEVGGKTLQALFDMPDGGATMLDQTPLKVVIRRPGQFSRKVFTLAGGN